MLHDVFEQATQLTKYPSKNYRKPLLQRYVIRILLMYVSDPRVHRRMLTMSRVPIYSISSWSSIISLKIAMFVDPIRDIYEVVQTIHPRGQRLTGVGFHYLYFLPTLDQLPRRGASSDNYDAWARASAPSLASKPFPTQSRYLGPSHLLGHKTRHPAICLAEAHPRSRCYHNEIHWNLQGGIPGINFGISLEWNRIQYQCHP